MGGGAAARVRSPPARTAAACRRAPSGAALRAERRQCRLRPPDSVWALERARRADGTPDAQRRSWRRQLVPATARSAAVRPGGQSANSGASAGRTRGAGDRAFDGDDRRPQQQAAEEREAAAEAEEAAAGGATFRRRQARTEAAEAAVPEPGRGWLRRSHREARRAASRRRCEGHPGVRGAVHVAHDHRRRHLRFEPTAANRHSQAHACA